MARYEGRIERIQEEGRAVVMIEGESAGIPGVSLQVNRQVCHCATDGSILKVTALNPVGAGVGDRVVVSYEASHGMRNAALLLGVPALGLLIGISLALALYGMFAFPVTGAVVAAVGFFLLGVVLGVSFFRKATGDHWPVIDGVIAATLTGPGLPAGTGFSNRNGRVQCSGCSSPHRCP